MENNGKHAVAFARGIVAGLFIGAACGALVMRKRSSSGPNVKQPQFHNRVDSVRPDAPDGARHGPFAVGVQTVQFSNAEQVDVINTMDQRKTEKGENVVKLHDRSLKAEIWYPAISPPAAIALAGGGDATYEAGIRDGVTSVQLHGCASRNALPAPCPNDKGYPLVIVSHGFPGNRFLLAGLCENLASKGFVVCAIDHTDSVYSANLHKYAFHSTLRNRPLDVRHAMDCMGSPKQIGPLADHVDATNCAIVGFSMGGYGSLVAGGAGLVPGSDKEGGLPIPGLASGLGHPLLGKFVAGSAAYQTFLDEEQDRVRAIVSIGPWGRGKGLWNAQSLAGLRRPTMLVAGDHDDTSEYDSIRQIFQESTNTERHLLTFCGAGHNAAAPIPAPVESWRPLDDSEPSSSLKNPFLHYADPVWCTVRMNNVAHHFISAFLQVHLKPKSSDVEHAQSYLDLDVKNGSDGVFAPGSEDQTYWKGFGEGTARALRFETLRKGS